VSVAYLWVDRFNASGFTTFERVPNPRGRESLIAPAQLRELVDVALSNRVSAAYRSRRDGGDAGRILPCAQALAARHRRMGAAAAPAPGALGPTHPHLEDVARSAVRQ
jgi:hypothetical protein